MALNPIVNMYEAYAMFAVVYMQDDSAERRYDSRTNFFPERAEGQRTLLNRSIGKPER
jgi:hypothetical protein